MQPLERPAVDDKAGGEVIEQLRMRRAVSLSAEVAWRVHEWLAEMPAPDAIDDDARRQRACVAEESIGQLQSAGTALEGGIPLGENRQEPARHKRAGLGNVAAGEHVQVVRPVGTD